MNYRKIKIKWDGVEYNCPVTIDLLVDMESDGVNPYQLSAEMAKGGIPPLGKISKLIAYVINRAGGNIDPMVIWDSLKTADDTMKVYTMVNLILSVIFPPIDDIERDDSEKKTAPL